MSDKDHTPTVNGFELDSVAAVANAFAFLNEPYNTGHIAVRSSEDLVIIHSRGAHFGHMGELLEAQNRDTSAFSQSQSGLITTLIRVSVSKLSEAQITKIHTLTDACANRVRQTDTSDCSVS